MGSTQSLLGSRSVFPGKRAFFSSPFSRLSLGKAAVLGGLGWLVALSASWKLIIHGFLTKVGLSLGTRLAPYQLCDLE